MVSINYATREVCCKIVYYGPGLSGKTTNLQVVHGKAPENTRGKLISLATEADRTLYFDFLPINIGSINGFAAKFQLYTVPGQVYYNATRKLVLRGVDGVVFVADSQADKMDDNLESLSNLKENLQEYGFDIDDLPIVIQYNKADLPSAMTQAELDAKLNTNGWPSMTAAAVSGVGVFDTLKAIMKMVLEKAKSGGSRQAAMPAKAKAEVAAPVQHTESTAPPALVAEESTGPIENQSGVPAAPTLTSPAPSAPYAPAASSEQQAAPAAANVFGAGRSSQGSGRKQVGAGYSAAATVAPAKPAPAETQSHAPASDNSPGVPKPGSIFGARRSSAQAHSPSSALPQSSLSAQPNNENEYRAHGGPSSVTDSAVQSSQLEERNVTKPVPPPTTEVTGHDPLEEPPHVTPKKRGFFSRLFGRK
jgi:signal recognition particle receptor subunit beta